MIQSGEWHYSPLHMSTLRHQAHPNDDSEASKPLKLLLDKERNQRLEEAIRRLPTQMRSCFIFRYNHSMSYQQIAVEMRLSIDAVKSHLKEARKRLIADNDIKDS